MPNNYYNFNDTFTPGQRARSTDIDREYQGVETAFDLLPASSTALIRGSATYAGAAGGTADVLTADRPNATAADADGDEIVFLASANNTGAATLEVDSNGARALVRADGAALVANDIIAGLIYAARYDITNTRWQLTTPNNSFLVDAAASAAAALVSETNAATSESNAATSETNAATSETNAAASAVTAGQWATHPEDDDVDGFPGQFSAFHWAQKSAASATGGLITGTGVVAPTTTGPFDYDAQLNFENANNLQTGVVGWVSNTEFGILSLAHGAVLRLSGENDAGTPVDVFQADPEGAANLYYAGSVRFLTGVNGQVELRGGNANDPGAGLLQQNDFEFANTAGTPAARLGHQSSTALTLQNLVHGGDVLITGEDATGAARTMIEADPDDRVNLYYDGTRAFGTDSESGTVYSNDSLTTSTATLRFALANFTLRSRMGHISSDNFEIRHEIDSASVLINGSNSISVFTNMASFDPDGSADFYFNGDLALLTRAEGAIFRDTGVNDPALSGIQNQAISMENASAAETMELSFFSSVNLQLVNRVHGGEIQMWAENNAGTSTQMFGSDPDGGVSLWFAGNVKIDTVVDGVRVRGDVAGDGVTQNSQVFLMDNDASDTLAVIGYDSSFTDAFVIRSRNTGRNMVFYARDDLGTERLLFSGDPDGATQLYHDGFTVGSIGTLVNGGYILDSGGNDPSFQWYQDDNTTRNAFITAFGTGNLIFRNEVHGGATILDAEDALGVVQSLFTGDPDGAVDIYFDGEVQLRTRDGGVSIVGDATDTVIDFRSDNGVTQEGFIQLQHAGSFTIRNQLDSGSMTLTGTDSGSAASNILVGDPDADVALFYDGVETFRTANSETDIAGVGAEILHSDGVFYPVMPVAADASASASFTIDRDDLYKTHVLTSGAAQTITLPASSVDIPRGSWLRIINESGNTWTISDSPTGVNLHWIGGNTTSGNRTVADDTVIELWKRSDTIWYIWEIGVNTAVTSGVT